MGTVILDEFGYDKVSHTYGTKQQIMDNLDKINPYEIVLSTDTDELYYKDNMNVVRNVINYSKAIVEDTIDSLKSSVKYRIGDVVEVLGYYTKGDDASHKRVIASIDDGSGVQIGNGLFANYIPKYNTIFSTHFGVISDNVTDNYEALQKMFDYGQKDSPDKVYNIVIDNKSGYILCSKGLDISSNGYCGTISMGEGINYGSVIRFSNPTKQECGIFTRTVIKDGLTYDRFGRRFFANGNFKLRNIRIRTEATINTEGVKYAVDSEFKNGIDVSSSSYVDVVQCHCENFSGFGINTAKWDTYATKNITNYCGKGIAVSERTIYNVGEDLVTNNLTIGDNNINECKIGIHIQNGTFVKVTGNTIDVTSSSAIVAESIEQIIIDKNYIERANEDNVPFTTTFQTYDISFVTQDINSKIIINRASNYDEESSLVMVDNQIPNNTSHPNHSIVAINAVKNIEYRNNSKRKYEVRDIEFFGVIRNVNQYGTIEGITNIEITGPIVDDSIKYNPYQTTLYKFIPNARIKSVRKDYLFSYSGFLINSDYSFVGNFKESLTQDNHNKVFDLSGSSYCQFDFTGKEESKPYALKFFSNQNRPTAFIGSIKVLIYLDGVKKFEEKLIDLKVNASIRSYVPTVWLGTDYKTLKIELLSSTGSSITNFCICDAEMSPSFLSNSK